MKKKYITIISIFALSLILIGFNDMQYFKVNKGFEIFSAILKELNKSYVSEIDSEELFEAAINGMLDQLDPYTSYFPEKDKEDIELITYGQYVGFGINIRRVDNRVTVSGISDDFMAFESGLRVGDIIYMIEDNHVEHLPSEDLKKYTQGTANSIAKVKVIRFQDTIDLELTRHNVEVNNISYYGLLDDGIGYIKLERFSRNSANQFRKAYFDLFHSNDLKGLIIDLRDNPGGLLEAALDICEMFIPKGSVMLSTKGRTNIRNYTYKTYSEPIDLKTPLCVIINENSASASEIVAGCLQDYDRAIITGAQSFGKGLVQTVMDLPYNSNLKITTAKYYTPSGRCIQRIEYYKKDKNNLDTNVFLTKGGRVVLENKGITPDTLLDEAKYTNYTRKIYNSNAIFNFATIYLKDKNIDADFKVDSVLLYQFKEYLIDKSLLNQSRASDFIDDIYEIAANEEILSVIEDEIDKLSEKILFANRGLFNKNSKELAVLLEYEFKRRYFNSTQLIDMFKERDAVLKKSHALLKDNNYLQILKVEEKVDSKQ